mgnify:CR=1 FL=1|jgi:hypothetical protein
MKFRITLKDPDGVYESVRGAVSAQVHAIDGLTPDEREKLIDARKDRLLADLSPWIDGEEYLTVEVDTEPMACTVVKRK